MGANLRRVIAVGIEQKKAPEKEGASAPLAQKKERGNKEPLFEGINIGMPRGRRGACGVFIPRICAGGGEKMPTIACMGGRIFVGKHYLEVEPGDGRKEGGQRSAKVLVKKLLEAEELETFSEGELACARVRETLEVPEGGERAFSVDGLACRIRITSFGRDVDPDADTNPIIMIPEKLLSGEEEVCDGMRFRTLNRGETMELEGGYRLRYFGRIPGGNAFLDIIGKSGKCVKEFEGKEGQSFEIRLAGVETAFILRLMRAGGTRGGIDVFWFPESMQRRNNKETENKI